ncbi:hypothetical protein VZT92_008285 [Zoarces viviparus]|uniref:Uncharacterized protein n=1 Tax=Zoarces viviparus TaxID=48416 RepID=A0AAW1FF35_ZOAVI
MPARGKSDNRVPPGNTNLVPCSEAHLQQEMISAVKLKFLAEGHLRYRSGGPGAQTAPPAPLQLSVLAADAASHCQSAALSDQVGNDFLEAAQQAKAIRQGNKGPPTAWSCSECGHSSRGRSRDAGQAFHEPGGEGSVTKA